MAGSSSCTEDDWVEIYEHRQVPVTAPDGSTIHVDAGMKDLLQLLWSRGIETFYSCEGNPEKYGGWGTTHNKSYILMRHTEASERLFRHMKLNSEHWRTATNEDATGRWLFGRRNGPYYYCYDLDYEPGLERFCIRFPKATMGDFVQLVSTLGA